MRPARPSDAQGCNQRVAVLGATGGLAVAQQPSIDSHLFVAAA
jgi:hypothetical protein